MQPEVYAAVLTLCNLTGKTKSNMCSELIETALKIPKYRTLLEEADEAFIVEPKEDTRTEARRKSLHRQPSAAVKREARAVKGGDESTAYTTTVPEMEMIPEKERDVVEGFGLDKITPERIGELQKLLKILEVMNK